jgi:hypothetical protein
VVMIPDRFFVFPMEQRSSSTVSCAIVWQSRVGVLRPSNSEQLSGEMGATIGYGSEFLGNL